VEMWRRRPMAYSYLSTLIGVDTLRTAGEGRPRPASRP